MKTKYDCISEICQIYSKWNITKGYNMIDRDADIGKILDEYADSKVKNLALPQVSKSVTCHHPLPYRKSTGQYTKGYTCTLCGKFVDR